MMRSREKMLADGFVEQRTGVWVKTFGKRHCSKKPVPIMGMDKWIPGWYEHIDKEPIYIHDRKHLIHECEKRGLLAKSIMKPSNRGDNRYEHARRGFC